ncbi:uncharacterized protein LOC126209934 [Schistocerca nitens]|uniref:uncharacterized protein LOC126209934 n=1 Tax=Schistocerca nitens TaxID=7011 RepID=UPI002117F44B|nr:uncharacterized protein LOC126209934 [Schistocerca nitens]
MDTSNTEATGPAHSQDEETERRAEQDQAKTAEEGMCKPLEEVGQQKEDTVATSEDNDQQPTIVSPKKRKKRRIARQGAAEIAPILREKAKQIGQELAETTQATPLEDRTTKKKTRNEDTEPDRGIHIPDGTASPKDPPPVPKTDTREVTCTRDWADDIEEQNHDAEMADIPQRSGRTAPDRRQDVSTRQQTTIKDARAEDDDADFF